MERADWFTAGRSNVGLLTAKYSRQSFARHTHDSFVFCVTERGAHGSWYRGENVIIPERTLTIVPPGEVHTGHALPNVPWDYRAIYPDNDFVAAAAREAGLASGGLPCFDSLTVRDDALAAAFVGAHTGCQASTDPLERESAVTELLITCLRRHARGRHTARQSLPANEAIQRAAELIETCYAQRLTLEDLEHAAGVSRFAVLRGFRRWLQITPHAYMIQLRVERAKELVARALHLRRSPSTSASQIRAT
jgi:hypothetical protein